MDHFVGQHKIGLAGEKSGCSRPKSARNGG
jgi:hypothetical protein